MNNIPFVVLRGFTTGSFTAGDTHFIPTAGYLPDQGEIVSNVVYLPPLSPAALE